MRATSYIAGVCFLSHRSPISIIISQLINYNSINMKYGSKMASDTLIRAENRSRRVETAETGLKTGEPSRTALGASGASLEGARAVCTEGPPTPLCDTWQQQSEPRRAVASGRRLRKATGPRLIVGSRLTRLGRKCLSCRPARLDRVSGHGLVPLYRSFWAGLRFGPL